MTLQSIAAWYRRQPRWVRMFFLGGDVGLGGYLWGDKAGAELTISKHLADEAQAGQLRGTIGCTVLDAADPGHCARVKE